MTRKHEFDAPWYTSPTVLVKRPLEFFPARGMTPTERLNSMVRFILYGSFLVAFYRSDVRIVGIGCIVITVLSIIHSSRSYTSFTTSTPFTKSTKRENLTECSAPTPNNPFMNTLTSEYTSNKKPACPNNTYTKKQTQTYFDKGLVREVSDVYNKRASDRQFYTTPVTGNGVPDTKAFRNFLFSETVKGPKCK